LTGQSVKVDGTDRLTRFRQPTFKAAPIHRRAIIAATDPRAVQGYTKEGEPMGAPGDQEGYYDISGTEQMFSSARDMAALLAANLGELPMDPMLREAMRLTQRGIFKISPQSVRVWVVSRRPILILSSARSL